MPPKSANNNKPSFDIENAYPSNKIICGVDEAGRGPLAGPVVAAAVILPADFHRRDNQPIIRDSKKMTALQREHSYQWIKENADIAVGLADIDDIDRLNILHASLYAMGKAIAMLGQKADIALIDGNEIPANLPPDCQAQAVIGGDRVSLSIAAASIIAKVERDKIMQQLDREYPAYGWCKNAGYGTTHHMQALEQFGVTAYHRTSFAPIRKIIHSR